MIYAPVIVPTLNRINHLKALIQSLQKNSYAKYTELYISVDYPPSERYIEGYNKVKIYLENGIDGFKKVNVFFQSDNLGPFDNYDFLINEVRKNYDRYISSEDDNVFSPNFLEYMNKCLEKYKNDDQVIAIGGHIHDMNWGLSPNVLIKNSVIYNAWGNGRWVDKDNKIRDELTWEYLTGILTDFKRAMSLHRDNKLFFRLCVDCVVKHEGVMLTGQGNLVLIDQVLTIYLNDAKKYVIYPAISKVKNCGDDGSGLHSGNDNRGKLQEIDKEEMFSTENIIELDDRKLLLNQYRQLFKVSWKRDLYTLLIWLRYYLFH